MNHSHQLLQRLSLEFAHGKDPLVQPRAGARPQGFLKASAVLDLISLIYYVKNKNKFKDL